MVSHGEAAAKDRKVAFRPIAKHIIGGRAERTKYGCNTDTNGEFARAMERTFKSGQKAAKGK